MSLQDFKDKIAEGTLPPLVRLTPLQKVQLKVPVTIQPNYDISEYEKSRTKEYFFRDDLDLSGEFSYCASCAIEEAGYDPHGDDRLSESWDDLNTGRLKFSEGATNLRRRTVVIEGTVFISGSDTEVLDSVPCFADLAVWGVPRLTSLNIFQELLLEAHTLEDEANLRVAFFTYFTALEAWVTSVLEDIKLKVPTELHHALEHLGLTEKFTVIFKDIAGAGFAAVPIYSGLIGLLGTVKKKRNDLAHGKAVVAITPSDLVDVFAVICTVLAYKNAKLDNFVEIRRYYYPK